MSKFNLFLCGFLSLVFALIRVNAQSNIWDLSKCLSYAETNHPAILQYSLNHQKTENSLKAANGLLWPSINGGLTHSYSFGSTINPSSNQRESLNVQYDQAYLQTNWDLLNWQNFIQISLAKLNQNNANYAWKKIQNDIRLNVISQFYTYQNNKAWLAVLETQMFGIEEQLNRIEKEVEIGNRAKSDYYDIKANLGTIQEQWNTAVNDRDVAKINLLNALNITQDSIDFKADDREVDENLGLEDETMLKTVLTTNPAYLEVENQEDIAKENVKYAKSNYYPILSASYVFSSFYNKTLNGNEANTKSFSNQLGDNKNQDISFGLSIPIFNRFQIKNKVENAKLDVLYAQYQKDIVESQLYTAIKMVQHQYQNSINKWMVLNDNFKFQELSFQKSEEKYKEGLIDSYTFFVVRNNWLQANYNLIKSKNDVLLQEDLWKIYRQQ